MASLLLVREPKVPMNESLKIVTLGTSERQLSEENVEKMINNIGRPMEIQTQGVQGLCLRLRPLSGYRLAAQVSGQLTES